MEESVTAPSLTLVGGVRPTSKLQVISFHVIEKSRDVSVKREVKM